jgi:hypothetical protein
VWQQRRSFHLGRSNGREWRGGKPPLLRVSLGLRDRVGTIEEKSHDFFEGFFADVDGAVNAIGGFDPIHFADGDLPGCSFSAIAEFDAKQITAEDNGHAVKGITVPGCGFPRRQPLSPDENISTMMQDLLIVLRIHV